jgi:hypothetical protein
MELNDFGITEWYFKKKNLVHNCEVLCWILAGSRLSQLCFVLFLNSFSLALSVENQNTILKYLMILL